MQDAALMLEIPCEVSDSFDQIVHQRETRASIRAVHVLQVDE